MMTFNNINNSSASRVLNTFNQDKAAEKIVKEMKNNENVNINFVEDDTKDKDNTILHLEKDTGKINVTINIDDIKRKAKEDGVDEDVFLSQQIASTMSASYLILDTLKDGKDPSKYFNNGEFLVASSLMADGMVRRTNEKAVPYLDKERTTMAEKIKAEKIKSGQTIETDSSDAFERAEKLGFTGINTNGWGDKIVKGFGDLKDLESLDDKKTKEKADKKTDKTDEEKKPNSVKEEAPTKVAEKDKKDDKKADKKQSSFIAGIPDWLTFGGLGLLAGKFLFPDKSGDVQKEADQKTQLLLAQQQQQFQQILLQQRAQQEYQVKLAAYQAQVSAANPTSSTTPTASSAYPAYTLTSSTPVLYSSSTTPSYVAPVVPAPVVPVAKKSDWT